MIYRDTDTLGNNYHYRKLFKGYIEIIQFWKGKPIGTMIVRKGTGIYK